MPQTATSRDSSGDRELDVRPSQPGHQVESKCRASCEPLLRGTNHHGHCEGGFSSSSARHACGRCLGDFVELTRAAPSTVAVQPPVAPNPPPQGVAAGIGPPAPAADRMELEKLAEVINSLRVEMEDGKSKKKKKKKKKKKSKRKSKGKKRSSSSNSSSSSDRKSSSSSSSSFVNGR